MTSKFQSGDALLIVDPQLDFFPGGALGVPEGDAIIPIVNEWIKAAKLANIPIFVSRDWHPTDHISFQHRGGPWPIHCVQNSKGASFHPGLNIPESAIIINKAFSKDEESYSALGGVLHKEGTPFAEKLQEFKVKRIWILGLALDYCVKYSSVDARNSGYEVHVILPATRSITKQTGQAAIVEMNEIGVVIESSEHP